MNKRNKNFFVFCLLLVPCRFISAFYDISESDPQRDIFNHLQEVSIMNGGGDGNFYPEKIISRAEALTIALRSGGIKIPAEFSGDTYYDDVDPNFWYAPIVARGVDVGIIRGGGASFFRPEQAVTKAEFLGFLFRSTLVKESQFQNIRNIAKDVPNDAWFKPYFAYAKKYQIATLPSDNLYKPGKLLTRREVARMTYRQLRLFHGNQETKMVVEIQGEIQQFLMLVRENDMTEAERHLHTILELNEMLIRTKNGSDAAMARTISKSMEHLAGSLRYFQYGKELEGIENLHLASKFAKKAASKEGKLGEFGKELELLIAETLTDLMSPVPKRYTAEN